MENKDYYVYVYLNQTYNGEWNYNEHRFTYKPFYVGKGRRKREIVHLCPYMLNQKTIKSSIIKSIISKIGELPIHYQIYTGLTNQEAINIEIDFIKHFGRQDNGTGILANCTDGGDGANNFSKETLKKIGGKRKRVYQYSLDGNFIKEWESTKSTEIKFASSGNISTAIKRNGTYGGYFWSHEKYDKVDARIKYQMPIKYINIQQIDKKTNETITKYDNVKQIIEKLNLLDSAKGKIIDCINGKLKTAYGYKWKI